MASTPIGVGVALACFMALGDALLTILVRRSGLWWFERAAMAFVLGAGAASVVWLAFIPAYRVIDPKWALLLAGCASVVVALRARRAPNAAVEAPPVWVRAGASLLAIEGAALLYAAWRLPLGWDGLMNFEFKARLAFEHSVRGWLPVGYFMDPMFAWSHPTYPLLLPSVEFWLYVWMGRVDQAAIKVLFPLFFAAMVAFVCGIVRRGAGAGAAIACGVAMGVVPALTVGSGAVTGYADVPMAAAAIGAVSCVMMALQTGDPETFVLAGILSGIAAWTKTEGLVMAVYLGGAAIVATAWLQLRGSAGTLTRRRACAVLWIPLALISVSPIVAASHLDRLPGILRYELGALLRPGRWGLVWPAFSGALALSVACRRLNASSAVLAGAVIVPLAVYSVIYLFSGWTDWFAHVATSFDRLLTPLAPLALVFTITCSWDAWHRVPSGARA